MTMILILTGVRISKPSQIEKQQQPKNPCVFANTELRTGLVVITEIGGGESCLES